MIWGNLSNSNKRRLTVFLKRFDRLVKFRSRSEANINKAINQMHIFNFDNFYKFKITLFMFQCIKLNMHSNVLEPSYPANLHNTRHSCRITRPMPKTNFLLQSIHSVGPKVWNSLPDELALINQFNLFKRKSKIFFLSQ